MAENGLPRTPNEAVRGFILLLALASVLEAFSAFHHDQIWMGSWFLAIGAILTILDFYWTRISGWVRWAIMKWQITYRVNFGEGAPKQASAPRALRRKNLRWRSSRRETIGVRMPGERNEARCNDIRGADVGIDMPGSENLARNNRIEGPTSEQGAPSDSGPRRTMFAFEGGGRYIAVTGCQGHGVHALVDGKGLSDSLVQFCSMTAPGWDDDKGGKK